MKEKCEHVYSIQGYEDIENFNVIGKDGILYGEATWYTCRYCPECGEELNEKK